MTHRDYLWCAVNLALDDEEELDRLCPVCRAEAEEQRCPVCGARTEDCCHNSSFDPARFEALRGSDHDRPADDGSGPAGAQA